MLIRLLWRIPTKVFLGSLIVLVACSVRLKAVPSPLQQVILHIEANDTEKAQAAIDTLLQDPLFRKEASVWYYQGVIYEQLMKKNIVSDSALVYLDQTLDAYHHVIKAEHSYDQFTSFAHNSRQALWVYFINRAVQYYKMEALEEALEQVAIAEKIDKSPIQNTLYKAIIADEAEKYDLAVPCYQAYIQYQQEKIDPPVYRALAQLSANQLNQPKEAETLLDSAMEAYPWDVGLLTAQHNLDLQTNKVEERKSTWAAALLPPSAALTPDDKRRVAIAYYRLAYLHRQVDDEWQQAVDYYQQVLGFFPKQVETLAQLGLIYYNKGAVLVQTTLDLPDDVFQAEGADQIAQADEFLKQALAYFEKAQRCERRNIYLLKTLHTLYTYFKNTDKQEQMAKKLRSLKGGSQLLEE